MRVTASRRLSDGTAVITRRCQWKRFELMTKEFKTRHENRRIRALFRGRDSLPFSQSSLHFHFLSSDIDLIRAISVDPGTTTPHCPRPDGTGDKH